MSDALYDALIEPLTQVFFQQALIGGALVAVSCGVIGCFVILRRMAFLGDALSHAMLAGVTAGYLFMTIIFNKDVHTWAMLIGSMLAAVVTVGLISLVSRLSRIKEDTAIGVIYTGIFAVGGALASVFSHYVHIDLLHFMIGQVLAISDEELWFSAAVTVVVLCVVILCFRMLQLTTFDPIMAAALGVPVVLMDYVLTGCTSLVVVCAVQMVGVIMVVGLLVTPAASAYLLCDRLSRMLVVSALFGVSGVVGGLYLSLFVDIAGGSSIVLFTTAQFLVVFAFAPRYGLLANWLRRRQMVPQTTVEDVLRSMLKSAGQAVSLDTLAGHVEVRIEPLRRAVRSMQKKGLLATERGTLTLTDAGRHEARRILRAHRLWETYLQRAGLPEAQLHEQAHKLEHVHDERTVDYLEDKLGHPLTDPHGAEIPEDFVDLVPGNPVSVSLLREGHRAKIVRVGPRITDERLRPDVLIRMGPRSQDGKLWTVELPDGSQVQLDHAQADDVIVELAEEDQGARG